MNYRSQRFSSLSLTCLALILPCSSGSAIAQVLDTEPQGSEIPAESEFSPLVPAVEETPEEASFQQLGADYRYILGPGDEISLSVVGFPDLSQSQIVLSDGTITAPLIGSVTAAGRTLQELELAIARQLGFYLVDPVVNLNLLSLRPVAVIIGGDVNRPGPVQLESLTVSSGATAPTLTAALSSAGGVRRTADLRNVMIQRRLSNGEETTLTVDLWQSMFQGTQGNDVLLQDGDVIFVSRAPQGAEIDPQLVARSSLAPASVNVRVIGEVEQPGTVQIPPNSNVLTALATAGGYNNDANLGTVALLRLNDEGQLEGQDLNLRDLTDNTPVQEGDVIVVPKKGYLNVIDAVARTLQPITAPFNFLLLLDSVFTTQ